MNRMHAPKLFCHFFADLASANIFGTRLFMAKRYYAAQYFDEFLGPLAHAPMIPDRACKVTELTG